MKDSIIVIAEALRLARIELECYRNPDCRASAEWTLKRLDILLNDQAVTAALAVLVPEMESPPLSPSPQPTTGKGTTPQAAIKNGVT
jgi:hypothetical protein